MQHTSVINLCKPKASPMRTQKTSHAFRTGASQISTGWKEALYECSVHPHASSNAKPHDLEALVQTVVDLGGAWWILVDLGGSWWILMDFGGSWVDPDGFW